MTYNITNQALRAIQTGLLTTDDFMEQVEKSAVDFLLAKHAQGGLPMTKTITHRSKGGTVELVIDMKITDPEGLVADLKEEVDREKASGKTTDDLIERALAVSDSKSKKGWS